MIMCVGHWGHVSEERGERSVERKKERKNWVVIWRCIKSDRKNQEKDRRKAIDERSEKLVECHYVQTGKKYDILQTLTCSSTQSCGTFSCWCVIHSFRRRSFFIITFICMLSFFWKPTVIDGYQKKTTGSTGLCAFMPFSSKYFL